MSGSRAADPGSDAARAREYRGRLETLRGLLDRRGDHAALLSSRVNFAWLTAGGTGHILQSSEAAIVAVLVTPDVVVAITQNIEAARLADEELRGLDIELVAVPWWEPGSIDTEALRRLARGRPVVRDLELEADLVAIRSVLSDFDRQRMGILGEIARTAIEGALADARPGSTENELVADLLGRLPGTRVPVVLAAADDRLVRYRHPLPGDTPIHRRVMAVLVAERWGLHVALTRIREFERPDADLARRIEAVSDVQAAMHAATRPGTTLGEVVGAAQAAYGDTGFADEWRDHHQGGTIGYRSREIVAIPGDPTVIEPGMAFAWNPSIAGAKAEDTMILDGDGQRVVTA
jgi:Xaa-Pro aminopeptidase